MASDPKAQVARMRLDYHPGDHVIFVVSKISTDPGPRAHDIHPAPFGETYQYTVDKYWTVRNVTADGIVELITRRGKIHQVLADDPRLRPARWWERWIYRDRFPDRNLPPAPQDVAPVAAGR